MPAIARERITLIVRQTIAPLPSASMTIHQPPALLVAFGLRPSSIRTGLIFALVAGTADLAAQTTPLVVGRPVRTSLTRGDTARYQVAADSNDIVRLTVDQIGANALVRVLAPGGRVVRSVNETRTGAERVQFEVIEKGVQQIQLVVADSSSGEVAVTLVAREQLSKDPKLFVAQLLAPWDRRDGPGAAVSVWRGGKTLFAKAYGMANLSYDIPFTTTSPTNIGSTSKQFTAFAIMLLVDEGKVKLDEDIRTYIPELPDLGKTVTLRNLLTHTTGFREVLNTLSLAGRRLDRGDFVDHAEAISVVQHQPALQNAPGAEFNYNNTSFELLSFVVERASGMKFPEFMARRVFGPIGMQHTLVRGDCCTIVPGATLGYGRGPDGAWRELGDLGGSMGAGGIYTTLGDLQLWVENYAHPKVGSATGIAQMMTPFTLSTGKSTGYGFGLFVDTQGAQKRIQHGGADVAHRSMLAYYPGLDAGITVQSNDAGFDSQIAFRIAQAFFPELAPAVVAKVAGAAAPFDAAKFDAYAGRYALDAQPQFVLTFTRSGDSLFTQATAQPRFPIRATSDSTFALVGVAASITFHRDSQGKVNALTLQQGGDQRATRIAGDAPKAWVPTPAELAAFSGRYFSEELEAFYTLSVKNGGLVMEHRRLSPARLAPGARDAFSGAGGALVFERDKNGQVIAFYLGNGRTRDVRFARVP